MHMPVTQRQWTAAAVRALPDDGNRYELIDGDLLVTPAPRWSHQEAVGELYHRLRLYLDREGVGHVMISPADIELEPETIVQPDVFVVPVSASTGPQEWPDVEELLVACEVLSPSTARYDRVTKRRFFSRTPVQEYWVVDPDGELFERSRRGDDRIEVIAEELIWHPAGAAAPFVLDVPGFFRKVRGES
jgi:Uma2 family endonuclease